VAEEARKLVRAVAGQARAVASSVALQYHHVADTAGDAKESRPKLKDRRPITETPTISKRGDRCQGERPFLLDP